MSRVTDPVAPMAHDHDHGTSGIVKLLTEKGESGVVVQIMGDQDISCQNMGAHQHGHNQQMHHHHDLLCLVEAGANTVRFPLAQAVLNLELSQHEVNLLKGQVAILEDQHVSLQNRIFNLRDDYGQVRDSLDEAERFMDGTPAQGPWGTVREQFLDWKDEEKEQLARLAEDEPDD
jgi:hypothetical protein